MQILDLLLPPACAGCGRRGGLLCAHCRASLARPSDAADRFVAADAGVVVGEALMLAVAAFAYRGGLRRALARLKYEGASRLAGVLVDEADVAFAGLAAITGPAALVPVPVHEERRRARGYNQAELIAARLAARHRLPLADPLRRARSTARQHRLGKADRLRNLRGAIGLAGPAPAVAILVDDIITTSATLEACAATLRDGGAREVYGFAIAREV